MRKRTSGAGRKVGRLAGFALLAALLGGLARPAQGQLSPLDDLAPRGDEPNVTASAAIEPSLAAVGDEVVVTVTVEVSPGAHIYSITQGRGGPLPTRLELTVLAGLEPLDDWQALDEPERHREPLFNNIVVEEHTGTVRWQRRYRVTEAAAATADVSGTVFAQVCTDTHCLNREAPVEATVQVVHGAPLASGAADGPTPSPTSLSFPQRGPLTTGSFRVETAGELRPGGELELRVIADLEEGWHVSSLTHVQEGAGSPYATVIRVDDYGDLEPVDEAFVGPEPEVSNADGVRVEFHEGEVVWTRRFRIPAGASGVQVVRGRAAFQACTDQQCLSPAGFSFAGSIDLSDAARGEEPRSLGLEYLSTGEAFGLLEGDEEAPDDETPRGRGSTNANSAAGTIPLEFRPVEFVGGLSGTLPYFLVVGFVAGLILNVMPCVLPVIGLKVMSFVQQAHEDRRRAFLLNLFYALGLLSVFEVLALLAVVAQQGWGSQFQSVAFTVVMVAIVFAMGLALLGVFEIPIPGFISVAASGEAMQKEGLSGAFLKGILTTLLATPCSGPLLGPTLAWSVQQPPLVTLPVWTAVGLGMASPYILIGIWPRLVRFLPKPGDWMVLFKQIMGFVLMGTVVWLLSSLPDDAVIPTGVLLVGIALACWMLGRTHFGAAPAAKWSARIAAAGFIALAAWLGFVFFGPSDAELPWQPYSRASWEQHVGEGRTVLVDFTADW